jgi:hypothetical protein
MRPDPAGSSSSQISLREYLEAKVDGERELNKTFRDSAAKEFELFKESLAREIREAAQNVSDRLKLLNELRAEVISDRANFVTREKYDAEMGARNIRVDLLERWQAKASDLDKDVGDHGTRIKTLEDWRNKLLGIGITVGLVSGLVGAFLMRLISGLFGR